MIQILCILYALVLRLLDIANKVAYVQELTMNSGHMFIIPAIYVWKYP